MKIKRDLRGFMKKKKKTNELGSAIGQFSRSSGRVELIPSLNPGDHGIGKLVEVGIHLAQLLLDLLRQFNVALLHGGAFFRERSRLEERDDLFLPKYALVLLLQVHKRVACFAVPDVWQACLHSQSQMVTYHLKNTQSINNVLKK